MNIIKGDMNTTRRKRKTLTLRYGDFERLEKAKKAYEEDFGLQVTWGNFLETLGTGYLVGSGVLNLKELKGEIKRKKRKKRG